MSLPNPRVPLFSRGPSQPSRIYVPAAAMCVLLAALSHGGVRGTSSGAHAETLRKDTLLVGADLRGANLQGANLQGANFEGADLREAFFWQANLQGAQLQGVDLRWAIGLTLQQIESATTDEKTRLPDYLRSPP